MDKNDNIVMISKDIRENERYIRERLADCGDIQIRKMRLGDERKVDRYEVIFPYRFQQIYFRYKKIYRQAMCNRIRHFKRSTST